MLKKGQMVSFKRPMSSMRTVLEAVENGSKNTREVAEYTKLRNGQIASALYNLAFIGAIESATDKEGRHIYMIPGTWNKPVAKCLCGVRSIFDVTS